MAIYISTGVAFTSTSLFIYGGLSGYTEASSGYKKLPQCKYFSRPVYKFVASKTNTVIATAVSFFMTDLVMHQLLPDTGYCILNKLTSNPLPCNITWKPEMSLGWMVLALPIMYVKYNNKNK
ncbi:MAG: hypothetical protein H0X29_11555 [Parachlamydiaceae bacterium]|nr:hypothetical protein [Parachlamydiaceae bacterium]